MCVFYHCSVVFIAPDEEAAIARGPDRLWTLVGTFWKKLRNRFVFSEANSEKEPTPDILRDQKTV